MQTTLEDLKRQALGNLSALLGGTRDALAGIDVRDHDFEIAAACGDALSVVGDHDFPALIAQEPMLLTIRSGEPHMSALEALRAGLWQVLKWQVEAHIGAHVGAAARA